MTLPIIIQPAAESDFRQLFRWVADQAGIDPAFGYIDRIERRVATLRHYPHRGAPHPEFGDGIRSLSFERRLLILYRVDEDAIRIHRVIAAERDLSGLSL